MASKEDDRPSSSQSGGDIGGREGGEETAVGGGEGQDEEQSGLIFPSIDVEIDITISVKYRIIKLQTEER